MKSILLSLIFCLALFVIGNSQTQPTQTAQEKIEFSKQRQEQIERDREQEKNLRELDNIRPVFVRRSASEERKAHKEAQKNLNIIRAPHSEDTAKYQEFLNNKNTGLFRLFPDLQCVQGSIVKVDGDCANLVPDSYWYSFKRKNYSNPFYDLRLEDERLWFDGFLSQAIVTELGEVGLNEVSLEKKYAQYILNFKPHEKSAEAKKQFAEISKTITNNGYKYGKVIKIKPDTTYLARIINYRVDVVFHKLRSRNPVDLNFLNAASLQKNNDAVIAFRIVRVEPDKSVTILWKQLSEKKSPKLKFEKGENKTDLKVNN